MGTGGGELTNGRKGGLDLGEKGMGTGREELTKGRKGGGN